MPFVITEHHKDHMVEVVYPDDPNPGEVADYTMRIKRVMDAQVGPWTCLVDQRAAKLLATKIMAKIGLLNNYAMRKGMTRSARVVSSSVAMVQARNMAEANELKNRIHTFMTREEAIAWLKT